MLTLLIATGCRPEAWAISERLLTRQTYVGPVRVVIVDDGETPQPVMLKREIWTVEVVRPEPFWQAGQNTQARNLAAGLAVIGPDESVVVWEDDDHYSAGYLSDVARWLESADLVGESHARYFNVATGLGREMRNATHASLCSTAMKGPALAEFRATVKRCQKFIDMDLWRVFRGRKVLHSTRHVVGIKGLPGRGGIGGGHRKDFGSAMSLRDLIGEDAALYGR